MYVLGLNAYHGDAAAVLLCDGAVVAAVEEERLRRVKHVAGFPTLAVRRCLEMAGISGADVAHVALGRDTRAHVWRKARFALAQRPSPPLVLDRLRNRRAVGDVRAPLAEALGTDALPPVHAVEHHPAHLASAFFPSPFAHAAVAAIDGFGDFVSTSVGVGQGSRLDVLNRVFFPHSLGLLYTAVTQHLGFPAYGDEYKVMGLAPYGRATRVDEVRQLIRLLDDGRFELDLRYFRHARDGVPMAWDEGAPTVGRVASPAMDDLLGPARRPGEPVEARHMDLAYALQAVHEEAVVHILRALQRRTGERALCLAGGCAMNSVANGKLRERTGFESIYVQPAAADSGTALGAALWTWHVDLGHGPRAEMAHAYWGPDYPDVDVRALLRDREDGLRITTFASADATIRETARRLAEGAVVGWFQGRMEWGARALGNRSILADPRRADVRHLLNAKIKLREPFRPFAPSVVAEVLDDYFVGAAPAPFMQQVYPVREDRRAVIPAVTHIDGTGRLQTVAADTNPRYHALLTAFGEITGVPVLLNTSFNENEPIVDTPAQAVDCFLRTDMDVLVVHDTLVERVGLETP